MPWTNKETIMQHLRNVYQDFSTRYEVFGVFLKGSQNYGVAVETSDIDLVVAVVPTLRSICENGGEIKEHLFKEEGEIYVKDIRHFLQEFTKPNVSNLEYLFSPYHVLNDKYAGYWYGGVVKNTEKILKSSPVDIITSTIGCGKRAFKEAFYSTQADKEVVEYRVNRFVFGLCCNDFIRNYIKYYNGEINSERVFVFENQDEFLDLRNNPLTRCDALTMELDAIRYFRKIEEIFPFPIDLMEAKERKEEAKETLISVVENVYRDYLLHLNTKTGSEKNAN